MMGAADGRGALAAVTALMLCAVSSGDARAEVARYTIAGDAIPDPLGGSQGDAGRGRHIVLDRTTGNCLICHVVPEPAERFMGNLGPDLGGIGSRLSKGQLRYRLVDASRLNPQTVMPPYHRTDGLTRVAAQWRGLPVLSAQQIEDVVAYLASLKAD